MTSVSEPQEPAATATRQVDGVAVLFQYGQPVPSFDVFSDRPAERAYLDLDAGWRFAFDPDDRGVADGWMAPDFDDQRWRPVEVPLPWDLYDTPGFDTYDGRHYGAGTAFIDGHAWYRVRVGVPAAWQGRFVKICFLAVSYAAEIYLNGRLLGEHEGGHTPFALDVSPLIWPGADNVVAVRVRRTPRAAMPDGSRYELPPKPVDYWPYAGITRPVFLEASAQTTVSKLLTSAQKGSLTIHAVVHHHGDAPARAELSLDPGAGTGGSPQTVELALRPGEVRVATATFAVPQAQPWSPTTPRLYRLAAHLETTPGGRDALAARYGLREIAVSGGRLLLNGAPIFLKGVNWHEETPDRGRALRREHYAEILNAVADLGANFVRNCGYTRHPDFYAAADERGVLVCDEPDNFWVESRNQQLQLRYGLSRALTAAMAWNQTNHPSVVLWSLHNESETADQATYRAWLTQLRAAVKEIDPQRRPVTWAAASSHDPAFDLAEVVGVNEYFGYFYGADADLEAMLGALRRAYPDRPVLITENGTYAVPGRHGPADQAGTEEWQADKLRRHWQTAAAHAGEVAGYTFWLLRDYKQRLDYNKELNGISAMGLTLFDGQPRLAYQTFRDLRNPLPGP